MSAKTLSAELQRWLPPRPRLVIALSGGPDSVYLAEQLALLLPKEDLTVAHFDHRLRAESGEDATFCRAWAEKQGIDYVQEEWAHPRHSEGEARTARLAFLQRVAAEQSADAIALGTHGDDEAETMMFRFVRGSGIAGLSGIRPFDAQTRLLRPLLGLTKAEILKHLHQHDIAYRLDATNTENGYARNYLRNRVFPLLEAKFPGCALRLRRQAQVFRLADDYLQQQAADFLRTQKQPQSGEVRIERKAFAALAPIVQLEVLRRAVAPQAPDLEVMLELQAFLEQAAPGKYKVIGDVEFAVYSEYCFVRRP